MPSSPDARPQAAARSPLLTADEIGERLAVERDVVLRWAREGKIPAVRISPKIIRFERDAVARALGVVFS